MKISLVLAMVLAGVYCGYLGGRIQSHHDTHAMIVAYRLQHEMFVARIRELGERCKSGSLFLTSGSSR